MNKPSRNEWMRDVELSQRNIVFPDTAANEARFWRTLISGKLTTVQVIGVVFYCGLVAGAIWDMAKGMFSIVELLFLGRVHYSILPSATLEDSEGACRCTEATASCEVAHEW
ncbi:MAG TPA: hypothetical protein VF133_00520 [Terriglobales bacterium]